MGRLAILSNNAEIERLPVELQSACIYKGGRVAPEFLTAQMTKKTTAVEKCGPEQGKQAKLAEKSVDPEAKKSR